MELRECLISPSTQTAEDGHVNSLVLRILKFVRMSILCGQEFVARADALQALHQISGVLVGVLNNHNALFLVMLQDFRVDRIEIPTDHAQPLRSVNKEEIAIPRAKTNTSHLLMTVQIQILQSICSTICTHYNQGYLLALVQCKIDEVFLASITFFTQL